MRLRSDELFHMQGDYTSNSESGRKRFCFPRNLASRQILASYTERIIYPED